MPLEKPTPDWTAFQECVHGCPDRSMWAYSTIYCSHKQLILMKIQDFRCPGNYIHILHFTQLNLFIIVQITVHFLKSSSQKVCGDGEFTEGSLQPFILVWGIEMGTCFWIADSQRERRAQQMQNKLLSKLNAPVVILLKVLINFIQADNAV